MREDKPLVPKEFVVANFKCVWYINGNMPAVIKSVSELYAHQFAEKHLLHPMGIYGYQWNKDPMGYPLTDGTDGGLGLRTRDIAKFG
ncbi:MAG: hypothetical protein JSV96_14500 [Candidatus Aminicenantes bacterium]|nr:MAG: hypothetical protein JSV96_14500 [Candidatus Aminicenantes bacterium]